MAPRAPVVAVRSRPLSAEERAVRSDEIAWSLHVTADPASRRRARAELVEIDVRVAHAVARRYRGRGVAVDDLEKAAIGDRLGVGQMQVGRCLARILDDLRDGLSERSAPAHP